MTEQVLISLYLVLKLIVGPPIDVLVDSGHALPQWYAPGVSSAAEQAIEEMIAAAEQQGLRVSVFSSYRSYEYQQQVYRREARKWPKRVDEFIAKPGQSEHQLGTAFDIAWPGLPIDSLDQRNMLLFEWVQANAHRFGFVISYPFKEADEWPYSNRWKPIDWDFRHEPWHIRYVGAELAEEMLEAGYLDPASSVTPHDFYAPWP